MPNGENVQLPKMDDVSYTDPIVFGPPRKLSGGDEIYGLKEEYARVQERKFVVKCHFVGITLIVNSLCSSLHKYRFCSSHQVNDVYSNNLQAAASIILSGNHYAKVERLAKFLKLEFLSKST